MAGVGGFLSPNTSKRLQDFSHGVMDHVKSYYNPQLWQADSKGASVLSNPAAEPKADPYVAALPQQLKEADVGLITPERGPKASNAVLRPSTDTETDMPEMSEVQQLPSTLPNGHSKAGWSGGLAFSCHMPHILGP